jgi:hypothetical protein
MSLVKAAASTDWADWRQIASEHGMCSLDGRYLIERRDD